MKPMRSAGCIVLTRPPKAGLDESFFLARRAKTLPFLGGFDVFPGGTEDACDAGLAQQLGCPTEFMTAAREMLEEAGVCVLRLPASIAETIDWQEVRRQLLGGRVAWWVELARQATVPDFVDLGLWITPPYFPVVYRARYFGVVSAAEPTIWPGELTQGVWLCAADALDAHRAGQLFLSYPVLETVRFIARYGGMRAAAAPLLARGETYPRGGGELLRGVQIFPVRTPTLAPATHTNCYILGGRQIVIVDPGTPFVEEQARLGDFIDFLIGEGRLVQEIWLTHHHPDHIGAVAYIRDRFGVPLAAHRLTSGLLPPAMRVDRLIEAGDVVELAFDDGPAARWRALFTPGHAPGHLCFFEEGGRTLISGDNVVGQGTVLIAAPDGHMGTYLASLRRMRDYADGFVLGAHGPPIAAGVERIDFYLQHRRAREESIFGHLSAARGQTIADLLPLVYADVDESVYPLAAQSMLAHLVHLVEQDRAQTEDGGATRQSTFRRS